MFNRLLDQDSAPGRQTQAGPLGRLATGTKQGGVKRCKNKRNESQKGFRGGKIQASLFVREQQYKSDGKALFGFLMKLNRSCFKNRVMYKILAFRLIFWKSICFRQNILNALSLFENIWAQVDRGPQASNFTKESIAIQSGIIQEMMNILRTN